VGSWLAGQNQYAIFNEPDSSQLELDGKAHFLASIGQTVGYLDYTAFMATDKYIRDHPDIIQSWTNAISRRAGSPAGSGPGSSRFMSFRLTISKN
jgi:NitT/TauT family transport system substrate-binding protein